MGIVTNLKQGRSGSDVKKLQEALIEKGYDVGKTGAEIVANGNGSKASGTPVAFGPSDDGTGTGKSKVEEKVEDKKDVAEKETITSEAAPSFYYDPYAKSDIVLEAESMLKQWQANQPGSYKPVWQDEADAYLSQYQNREPFSYDFNSDALYNQYKDQYIQQGQMAMMDTMGQAAAMTGGYGNSYAQTVGQQAYNQYLGQLNEVMPELYGMAYDRYSREGQDLLNMYDLYMNREAMDYSKHQDTVDNWYREMSRLTDNANTLYERDYNDYLLGYNTAFSDHQTKQNQAFTEEQAKRSKYDSKVAQKQQELVNAGYDITVDGIDGPETQAAWADYNGTEDTLGTKRKGEIEEWLISAFTNPHLSSSFDPNKLIQGAGFLKTDEERAYARAILAELK